MTHNEQDVERVARAICNSTESDEFDSLPRSGIVFHSYMQQAKAALYAMRCPHVHTSTEGTSYCTLAETSARRMNDIEQAAKGLREAATKVLLLQEDDVPPEVECAAMRSLEKALAQYDALVKGE